MSEEIGKKIKELRTYYSIFQGELANGICTQGTISKIEKDEIIPNASILHKIAQRLGVDINYFFGTSNAPRLDYIKETCEVITDYIRDRNYKEALEMVKLEKKNPLFRRPELQQFLLWREAICEFYLNNQDHINTIKKLSRALELKKTTSKSYSSIELDIMLSISIIYSEKGMFTEAKEEYRVLIQNIKKLPYTADFTLYIRIYYNAATNAHFLGDFNDAVSYCDETIKFCLNNKSMYLLGQTFFQKGESLYSLHKDVNETLNWYLKALSTFDLLCEEQAKEYIEGQITKLKK